MLGVTKSNGSVVWLALGLVWLVSLLVISVLIVEPKVELSAAPAPPDEKRNDETIGRFPVRQTAQSSSPEASTQPTPIDQPPDKTDPPAPKQFATSMDNVPALQTFLRALFKRKAGRRTEAVRVIQFGDSHFAAGVMAIEMRKTLQRDFGDESAPRRPVAVIEVRGVNGARAVELTKWSEREFAIVAEWQPELIMLAYGANEVTDDDWTAESYERMFAGIIRRFRRAAPHAAILVVGPPDRAVKRRNGWQSVERMPVLIEAQRRAALETGAAFWDAYGAMGGAGAINDWVARGLGQRDHVHLTNPGYVKLSELLYNDLTEVFAQAVPARDEAASESGER